MNHGPGFKGFVTCLQSGHRHQLEVGAHNITYLGVSNPSETHLFLVIYRFYFIVVTWKQGPILQKMELLPSLKLT